MSATAEQPQPLTAWQAQALRQPDCIHVQIVPRCRSKSQAFRLLAGQQAGAAPKAGLPAQRAKLAI